MIMGNQTSLAPLIFLMPTMSGLLAFSRNSHRVFRTNLEGSMHKVFISYHHCDYDSQFKETLIQSNIVYPIFIDGSVDTGDIDENLDDQKTREIIRDEYLKDTTVTIVLVGTETKKRKHVDWEIYSSMYDGAINKKSGLIVINLPSVDSGYYDASHDGEKERVYPETTNWITIKDRKEYERRYPYMPERIIDNLLESKAKISVVNWKKIEKDFSVLSFLIDAAYNDRKHCEYNLQRPMKRKNN